MDGCHLTSAYIAAIEERSLVENIKAAQPVSQAEGSRRSLTQIAVLHIPHSSRQVPAEERQAILLDDAALKSELLSMTDFP